MSVRLATAADSPAIARVHVASWQAAYRDIVPADFLASLSVAKREAYWAGTITQGAPRVLVAEQGGIVTGFSAFGPSRDEDAAPGTYEVWAIYLAPAQWSSGTGRALWLATHDALLALGADRVSLWVMERNARAIRFYEAAGFRAEPGTRKSFEIGGAQIEELRYVRRLDRGRAEPAGAPCS